MKGISRDLREMNIPMKLDAKLVKKQPYRLNLRYKEGVKAKLERIMYERIIKHVKELE